LERLPLSTHLLFFFFFVATPKHVLANLLWEAFVWLALHLRRPAQIVVGSELPHGQANGARPASGPHAQERGSPTELCSSQGRSCGRPSLFYSGGGPLFFDLSNGQPMSRMTGLVIRFLKIATSKAILNQVQGADAQFLLAHGWHQRMKFRKRMKRHHQRRTDNLQNKKVRSSTTCLASYA